MILIYIHYKNKYQNKYKNNEELLNKTELEFKNQKKIKKTLDVTRKRL